WLAQHAVGLDQVEPGLAAVDVEAYAAICDLEPHLVRRTAPPTPTPPSGGALTGGGGGGPRIAGGRRSPVAGAPIISGLVPANVIAEEILTDHPDRYRAMLVESANPAHSLADSPRMREALRALDFVVVIDVAMTETAQLADYVLPASSQYEKW